MGYRYFDSIEKDPVFPFGYGLQYTDFKIESPSTTIKDNKLVVEVDIQNIGERPGKEIAQLYVSLPSGKLDQPYQVLAAFAKTEELAPGQKQQLQLQFSFEELASFDEETACEILEAGKYILRVGNSSRHTQVCGCVELRETIIIQQLSHAGGKPDFTDWKPNILARLGGKLTMYPFFHFTKTIFL